MEIKILGTGCQKCKTLEKMTTEVISENQFTANVTKVEDIMDIMNYGILSTPGFVIDEKVVISGRLPSKDEIKKHIQQHLTP